MSSVVPAQDRPAGADARDVDRCIRRFETAWREGKRPVLEDFLPPEASLRAAALVELVHIDLEFRLEAGEDVRVETYLRRYPTLARERDTVLELIAAEFEQRQRLTGPTVEEYLERFPEYRADLVLECQSQHICRSSLNPESRERWARSARLPGAGVNAVSPGLARIGKFQLVELLGSGAFANVYKAWDAELERVVALKVPRAGAGDSDRFVKEARSAARLQHPNIVAPHEAGQIDGTCYIASEFVAGKTLADHCRRGPPPPREAAEILAVVAEALHYAHQQGVIHRDIKPSNILLDAEGRAHLTDFGLAKRDRTVSAVTLTGQVLGTPAYMSPEQARGDSKHVDARSDVYSLGVVLYQTLAGMLPFPGENLHQFIRSLEEDPVPLRRLNSNLARDLETICARAMSKQPSRRYASAAAFAEDLRRFLAGWPVKARPMGKTARLARWVRRKLLLPFIIVALEAALVLSAVGATALWLRDASHRRPIEGRNPSEHAAPNPPANEPAKSASPSSSATPSPGPGRKR